MLAKTAADNWAAIAGIVTAVIALVGFVSSARGRSWVRRQFSGESLQQVTATFADQVAATQAAYTISEAERRRLEEKVASQDKEIHDLRKQIEYLGSLVTAREDIKRLSGAEAGRHEQVMGAFSSLGAEVARVVGALERLGT